MLKISIHETCSNLPREGWLQACLVCNDVTGNEKNIVTIATSIHQTIEYTTYLCRKCETKINSDEDIKNKFFRRINKKIIKHLNNYNLYKYTIIQTQRPNNSRRHFEITAYLHKLIYLPVEPNPPAPLDVSSNSSTSSTLENGDKSGVQI
jgi:hypothetical protein